MPSTCPPKVVRNLGELLSSGFCNGKQRANWWHNYYYVFFIMFIYFFRYILLLLHSGSVGSTKEMKGVRWGMTCYKDPLPELKCVCALTSRLPGRGTVIIMFPMLPVTLYYQLKQEITVLDLTVRSHLKKRHFASFIFTSANYKLPRGEICQRHHRLFCLFVFLVLPGNYIFFPQ